MPLRSPAVIFALTLFLALAAPPARSGEFADAAGRRVMLPDSIGRVMPAERNAEVMVYVLAPDKLAGLSRGSAGGALLQRRGGEPVLAWRPRSNPATMVQTAQRLRADLIIDAGPVTPERAAYAGQVQQQTGIPYILIDDSFARLPRTLRTVGRALGVVERAEDLALFAEHAIAGLHGRLLIRPANTRPRVYFGRGREGLTVALPGSPPGEAIDEAGAINVAGALGRAIEVAISPSQLLAWNPEIIIAEQRAFYDALRRNRAWGRLAAVRNNRVYLEPTSPFGWIEDPSGVNRLIGLYWLSDLFYPDTLQEDLRTVACEFYDKFYRVKLTNAQLEAMVRPAGLPPLQMPQPIGVPLAGLGAAPPSTLPSDAPGRIDAGRMDPLASTPGALSGAPAMPGAAGSPMMGSIRVPGATATSACTLPGAQQSPIGNIPSTAMPGVVPLDNAPAGTPGLPPPGRRGQAVPGGLGTLGTLPR